MHTRHSINTAKHPNLSYVCEHLGLEVVGGLATTGPTAPSHTEFFLVCAYSEFDQVSERNSPEFVSIDHLERWCQDYRKELEESNEHADHSPLGPDLLGLV